jgi:hypothetical protein
LNTRLTISLFAVVSFFLCPACSDEDKEDSNWGTCYDCTLDSWIGAFSGTATHFNASTLVEVDGLDITIEFEETATDYLTAYVSVPNYFSATISGAWTSPYSISFAGSGSSIFATIYKQGEDLMLNGNAKKFHYKVDSLIIDEVVNFDVYKTIN